MEYSCYFYSWVRFFFISSVTHYLPSHFFVLQLIFKTAPLISVPECQINLHMQEMYCCSKKFKQPLSVLQEMEITASELRNVFNKVFSKSKRSPGNL